MMKLQKDNNFKGKREDGSPCDFITEVDHKMFLATQEDDMKVQIG